MCLHIKMGQCVNEGLIVGGKSGIIMLFFISEGMLSFPDNLELSNNKRVISHHAQKTRNGWSQRKPEWNNFDSNFAHASNS